MTSIEKQRVVVVGGSRGLGLGVVEAAVAQKAEVTVVARSAGPLAEVKRRLGVSTIVGDATDPALARNVLKELRPSVVVVSAGAVMPLLPIHEQSWENFETAWNVDVKAALFWIQEAIRLPLAPGSRVLVFSSGAALNGVPSSGGYAGAKRMVWMLANYANTVSAKLGLGIQFQAVIPRQMVLGTGVGQNAAEGHAKESGTTAEAFVTRFGKQLTPRSFGELLVGALDDPKLAKTTALGINADNGVVSMDTV